MKVLTTIFVLLVSAKAMSGPAYPLKLAPGQHYVVDQNGTPFFIQGDSPWYLTEDLNGPDVDYYLSNRWVQGYNSIILDIAAKGPYTSSGTSVNYYGQMPFTNTIGGQYTNLLAWNVNYFTNVDWVIRRAAFYGICVFAYPLYDGYGGSAWYAQMAGNPTNALYAYGQFIGNRYKDFPNIVWVGAGDYKEPNAPSNCLWNIVAAGIASEDTNHLITAQVVRPTPASFYSEFVTLNSTYPGWFSYIESLENYQRSPVLASFDREPFYEHRNVNGTVVTALNCRQFAYWSIFSGDMGHFYGDEHQWPFGSGWQNEMWDEGATTITNVIELMKTRPWWDCVPDADHSVVTSGYGTNGTVDYVTCTREATGKTIMAYIPQDMMTPTVDMTKISGSSANAWWFNPRTGAATSIGSYSTTGTHPFTPPDTNDWVLVLDDASQNYGPPGVSPPQKPVITTDLMDQVVPAGATASLEILADGTPSLGYQWFFAGTNLSGATSNPLVLTNVTPAQAGSYQVLVTNALGAAASLVATLSVTVPNTFAIEQLSDDLLKITLTGTPGQTYTLQYTTSLDLPWQTLGSAILNSSGIFSFYTVANSAASYYRSFH